MAATLPGLGSDNLAPLTNKQLDYATAGLTPDDFFVLTRVDGRTTLRDIIMICGFAPERTVTILQKLRSAGAIYFPGQVPQVTPPPPVAFGTGPVGPPTVPPSGAPRGKPATAPPNRRPTIPPGVIRPPLLLDAAALAEDCDLSLEQKRAILTKQATLRDGNYFDVLEVPADADRRTIKRSYFKLSKDFHPDRFFGKNLGSFAKRLAEIMDLLAKVFEVLGDDARREQYLGELERRALPVPLTSTTPATTHTAPHTPGGPPSATGRLQAAEIFERAVQHHVTGEHAHALKAFASAIAIDPQPRYLRRASEAALRAQELRLAEEYGKKAAELDPDNATSRRMLAKVYRAQGRLADARAELELAARLDPQNPHVAAELEELTKTDG